MHYLFNNIRERRKNCQLQSN